MTITQFFRYLLAHEPTNELATLLVEAYGTRVHLEGQRARARA